MRPRPERDGHRAAQAMDCLVTHKRGAGDGVLAGGQRQRTKAADVSPFAGREIERVGPAAPQVETVGAVEGGAKARARRVRVHAVAYAYSHHIARSKVALGPTESVDRLDRN